MSITVKEKDHWKQRIERRIDHKIKQIEASEPTHVWEEMSRRAEQMAWEDLAIATLMQESVSLKKQVETLEAKQQRVWAEIWAVIRGVDVTTVRWQGHLAYDVERLIDSRKSLFLETIRAEHPKGQQIQRLQQEKEELLDTVWLATSASQIKELWSQIAEGLQSELTPFQLKALAIEPISAIPSNE